MPKAPKTIAHNSNGSDTAVLTQNPDGSFTYICEDGTCIYINAGMTSHELGSMYQAFQIGPDQWRVVDGTGAEIAVYSEDEIGFIQRENWHPMEEKELERLRKTQEVKTWEQRAERAFSSHHRECGVFERIPPEMTANHINVFYDEVAEITSTSEKEPALPESEPLKWSRLL